MSNSIPGKGKGFSSSAYLSYVDVNGKEHTRFKRINEAAWKGHTWEVPNNIQHFCLNLHRPEGVVERAFFKGHHKPEERDWQHIACDQKKQIEIEPSIGLSDPIYEVIYHPHRSSNNILINYIQVFVNSDNVHLYMDHRSYNEGFKGDIASVPGFFQPLVDKFYKCRDKHKN